MAEHPKHIAKPVETGLGVPVVKEVNPRFETLVMADNRATFTLPIVGWEEIRVEEHQNICGSNTGAKQLHKTTLMMRIYN